MARAEEAVENSFFSTDAETEAVVNDEAAEVVDEFVVMNTRRFASKDEN